MSIYSYIFSFEQYKEYNRIVCWKNQYCLSMRNDGRDIDYYFSIPIYDKEKHLLEAEFDEMEGAGINRGANSKVLIHDNNIRLILEQDLLEMEFLSDIELEATLNGCKIECASECLFYLKSRRPLVEQNNGRCFILRDDTERPIFTIGAMYSLLEGEYGAAYVSHEKTMERYLIKVSGKNDKERVVFEINSYIEKLILDTTIEKKQTERNNAFGCVAYLKSGEEEELLFSKFDFLTLEQVLGRDIEKAELCIPILSVKPCKLQIKVAKDPWCSLGLNWNEQVRSGRVLDEAEPKNGYVRFDITNYLKSLLRSGNPQYYGFIIKNLSADVAIVATGDNYYTPQILKIQKKGEKYGNNCN